MAGYQDQLIAPAPYTETIPVDAYTKVGMIKQQQYDEGVQKVQGMVDSVAGIDALMPEQKDYLNRAVGQLQSQVSTLASSDFSNQQIVNSVGHLTGQIASDPIIQNTVYSTNAYRNEAQKMKQAQDSGKSSPANEYVFQRQFQNWIQSGDPSKTFNATYTPYTDYKGKMLKALNEGILGKGHEDEWMTEMPYIRDGNGKPLVDKNGQPMFDYNTLIEKYKGVSADKIRNVIDSTLDDNDRNQMAIDGQYQYKDYGKKELKDTTDRSYQGYFDNINSTIQGLQVKRAVSQNDADKLKQIDNEIKQQQDSAKNYQASYLRDIDTIDKNPEGYKGLLYSQNWLSKFSEGYSYAQHSLSYADNPGFKNALDEKKLAQSWEEFRFNKEMQMADLSLKQRELDFKMGKLPGGIGGAAGNLSSLEPITNPDHTIALDEFVKNNDAQKAQSDLQDMAFLARKNPELVDKLYDANGAPYYVWASDPNASPQERKAQADKNQTVGKAALSTYRDSTGTGDPDTESWKASTQALQANWKAGQKVVQDAQNNADKIPELNLTQRLRGINPLSITGADGNQYNIEAKDILQFNQKVKTILNQSNPDIDTGVSSIMDLFLSHHLGGVFRQEDGDRIFTSPTEKVMWNAVSKYQSGSLNTSSPLNRDEVNILGRINTIQQRTGDMYDKRQTYIANQLKNVLPAFQPVSTPLEQFKGEDKQKAATWVQQQLVGGGGKANTGLNFKESDINEMLGKKNLENTRFYIIDRGDDKFSVRLSNTDVIGSKQMEIDLTRPSVENLLGGSMGVDMFKSMRDMQRYSSLSNGPLTTNVLRQGVTTATPLNNGNIKGFNVKYDIEQGNGGGQMIRLYVYDKDTKQNKEVVLNPGTMMNEAQVIASLQYMNDDTIKTAIKDQPAK